MEYQNRHQWDYYAWPDLLSAFRNLAGTIWNGPLDRVLGGEIFTVSSQVAGCRHCQAHGAYGLYQRGVEVDKIRDLWSFEQSDQFDERERAALRFAMAASYVPNAVTAAHHTALREHFSDEEVRNIFAVVSLAGFLNRWNDSLATVTDQESADWAAEHLASVGWALGKHQGTVSEQRTVRLNR